MKTIKLILIMLLNIGAMAQNSEVKHTMLKLYAYPISNFTKIPITVKSIKDASEFKKKIKNGNEFISKLESILSNKVESKDVKEINTNVRIYIEVYQKKKIVSEIIINKGKNIQYKGKCYDIDKELMLEILELIPKKKRMDYTPEYLKSE